jgi:hypothetical protein
VHPEPPTQSHIQQLHLLTHSAQIIIDFSFSYITGRVTDTRGEISTLAIRSLQRLLLDGGAWITATLVFAKILSV